MIKLYSTHGGSDSFWKDVWKKQNIEMLNTVKPDEKLTQILSKHLQPDSKIIEAGCGLGRWVIFLSKKGHDMVGVDFEKNAINKLNEIYRDYDFRHMDVEKLGFPGESFDAYLSFGVVEHAEEGPKKILSEACRVLKTGGIAFVAVPYANLYSRFAHRNEKAEGVFYEYLFTKDEIITALEKAGFEVMSTYYYDNANFARGMRAAKPVKSTSPASGAMKKVIKKGLNALPHSLLSHMIVVVAKKRPTSSLPS